MAGLRQCGCSCMNPNTNPRHHPAAGRHASPPSRCLSRPNAGCLSLPGIRFALVRVDYSVSPQPHDQPDQRGYNHDTPNYNQHRVEGNRRARLPHICKSSVHMRVGNGVCASCSTEYRSASRVRLKSPDAIVSIPTELSDDRNSVPLPRSYGPRRTRQRSSQQLEKPACERPNDGFRARSHRLLKSSKRRCTRHSSAGEAA